jgi:hypothetical protein
VALVLAIEPDLRQSRVLERIVRERVHADLLLVDSPDAAVAALSTQIPDVILVPALLSPSDEEDLLEKVRSLDGARHLQTYTIPQLASTTADEEEQENGGFFSRLWRKKNSTATDGCDPDLFAQEIVAFLARAQELKSQTEGAAAIALRLASREGTADAVEKTEPQAPASGEPAEDTSAWASPFEWRRSTPRSGDAARVEAPPESAEDAESQPAAVEPGLAVAAAEAEARRQREDEERLRKEEAERQRLAAEAEAKRQREEEERLRKEEEAERQRLAAEAEARRQREDEARRRKEEERLR